MCHGGVFCWEVLKSVVANEEEATCFGEDNSVPEVPNEMGQSHEVLWSGMASSALHVPEVTAYLRNLPNSYSLRVINPNHLDPPVTREAPNGLDQLNQQSNKDGSTPSMVYWDTWKYDVCKGAGQRHSKDIVGTPLKILNPNTLDPSVTAHILNGSDPPW